MENVRNVEYFKQNVDNIFVCDGDLLKDFDNGKIDIFAHGCNCLNRFSHFAKIVHYIIQILK